MAHFIVFANEKGGTGKSTTAVHTAIALASAGWRVGAIDLDSRQKSFARYLENRAAYCRKRDLALSTAEVKVLGGDDPAPLIAQLDAWRDEMDAIVIDTPGRDDPLARAAIGRADTLVTPINDSFLDLDLLGEVDPENFRIRRPSFYAELVWDARKARAKADGGTVDWVVLRNRLSTLEARNMRRVGAALDELAKRVGYRVIPGLSERVVYRELFPRGLTLLDLAQIGEASLSHVAARQELREMIGGFALTGWEEKQRAAAAGPVSASGKLAPGNLESTGA